MDAVEEVDWITGRVLDAIDDAGVRNSTLVIWTSDNGPWTQEEQRAGSVLKKCFSGGLGTALTSQSP